MGFAPYRPHPFFSKESTAAFSPLGCWTAKITVTLDTPQSLPQLSNSNNSTEVLVAVGSESYRENDAARQRLQWALPGSHRIKPLPQPCVHGIREHVIPGACRVAVRLKLHDELVCPIVAAKFAKCRIEAELLAINLQRDIREAGVGPGAIPPDGVPLVGCKTGARNTRRIPAMIGGVPDAPVPTIIAFAAEVEKLVVDGDWEVKLNRLRAGEWNVELELPFHFIILRNVLLPILV